jgi:hypothetical protein
MTWYLPTVAIMVLCIWLNVNGTWDTILHQDTIIKGEELCKSDKDFYYSNFFWCEKYDVRYNSTNTEVKP